MTKASLNLLPKLHWPSSMTSWCNYREFPIHFVIIPCFADSALSRELVAQPEPCFGTRVKYDTVGIVLQEFVDMGTDKKGKPILSLP